MPLFNYKARTATGAVVTGSMETDSLRHLISILKAQHQMVITATPEKENIAQRVLKRFKVGGVRLGDLVLFSRQLATLINAGIPIVQCLNILVDQTDNKNFKRIISYIREDIERGASISIALGKHPSAFSTLYVSMIKAGETGGILDEILERLAVYLENLQALQKRIKAAMMYPIVVSAVAILIVIFMLVLIIPAFEKVFESFGAALPLPTQILINFSRFIRTYIVGVLVVAMIAVTVTKFSINRSEQARYSYDRSKLKLPVFGSLLLKIAIARFARTLGTLVRSGVAILEALEIVAKTAGNKVVELAIMGARSSIREGERITDPLRESDVFTPMVIQMISIGEETGALDSMLMKIADYYDREISATIEGLASLLEPLLIVFLGVIVGTIVICMYLPIFTLPAIISGE